MWPTYLFCSEYICASSGNYTALSFQVWTKGSFVIGLDLLEDLGDLFLVFGGAGCDEVLLFR